eukprot:m.2410 g.2410  ORF g.2410 m.2410 type:complete len:489 (-) comp1780_c0_seq1:170-1636(-)
MSEAPLILSKQEWERIQSQLRQPDAIQFQQEKIAERKRLHDASVQSVSTWSNSILGQRQANLAAKAKRDAENEARKKLLDEEEEQLREEKRRKDILRAKRLQYENTDKARNVRAALLTSEVMRERDNQKSKKNTREAYYKKFDQELMDYAEQKRIEAEEEEERKQKTSRDAAMRLRMDQIEQAAIKRKLSLEKKQKDASEAFAIDEDVRLHKEEEDRKVRQFHERRLKTRQELEEQVQEQAKLAKLEREMEQNDKKKIQLYAESRDRLTKMRYDKEMEQRRLVEQQRLIAAQTVYVAKQSHEEEEEALRLKVIQERDEAAKQAVENKAAKRRRELEEIARFRETELSRKAREAEEAQRREVELAQGLRLAAEKAQLAEYEKQKKKKEALLAIQAERQREIDEKIHQRQLEKEAQVQERLRLEQEIKGEEEVFKAFSTNLLQEAQQRGCSNTYLLQKAIGKSLPQEQSRSSQRTPQSADTARRLGLNWE